MEAAKTFLRLSYVKLVEGAHSSLSPWKLLCLMHCWGQPLGMPAGSFPSIEQFGEISSADEAALWESMESFFSFFAALAVLDASKKCITSYIDYTKESQGKFCSCDITSLEDMSEADSILMNMRLCRRSMMNFLRTARQTFARVATEEMPVLQNAMNASGLNFAIAIQRDAVKICEELRRECQQNIPPAFDADAVRALLDRVTPPLPDHVRKMAEEEISALDSGSLAPERSPLLSFILPSIQGEPLMLEKPVEEVFPDMPYPYPLIVNVKNRQYSLAANDVNPTVEPESEVEPEAEPEVGAEAEPEVGAEAEPEFEPEAELEVEAEAEPEVEAEAEPEVESETPAEESACAAGAVCSTTSAADEHADVVSGGASESSGSQMGAHDRAHFVAHRPIGPAQPATASSPSAQQASCEETSAANKGRQGDPADFDNVLGKGCLAQLIRGSGQVKGQEAAASVRAIAGDDTDTSSEPTVAACNASTDRYAVLESGIHFLMQHGEPPMPGRQQHAEPDELFKQLIVLKDGCALYWLARTLGENSTIPVWLAELLQLGTHYLSGIADLRPRIAALCTTAVNCLQGLDEKMKLLLATAILRPAILMPEQSMGTITTILASGLSDYGLVGFFNELSNFVRIGKPLEDHVFLGKNAKNLDKQKELLKKETEDLFQRIMRGKMNYQPATKLRKEFFEKRGIVGKVLEGCLRGVNVDNGLQDFIDRYKDVRNIEGLIDHSHARHSTRSIEAGARQKLIDEISFAVELAKKWLSLFMMEGSNIAPSYAEQRLDTLYTAMDKTRLESCPEGIWFISQMDDLYSGELPGSCSPIRELELWPLRLPCAYAGEDAVFRLEELMEALHTRNFDDSAAVAASLAMHMSKGRISQADDFLNTFPAIRDIEVPISLFGSSVVPLSTVQTVSLGEVREKSCDLWQKAFDAELEKLKEYLGDSYFRGAILYDQQNKISILVNDILSQSCESPNKAQAIRKLKGLHKILDEWNESSLRAVCVRIDELRSKADNLRDQDALGFLDELKAEVSKSLVFSAAWDNIARMENYLAQQGELPALHAERPAACSTAHQFYAQLSSGIAEASDRASILLWQKVCSMRNRRMADKTFLGSATELLRWLGFTLSQQEQPTEILSTGSPNYWRVARYSMVLNSPLPHWGSSARGKHVIAFGWELNDAVIDNLLNSNYIRRTDALTIISCGALSFDTRKRILQKAKGWSVFPLVIDTNSFYFLASMEPAVRTEKMFEIALAGSPYNPYTPDVAGAVPREMFFGRENDKASVLSEKGACIIYGGRQLGKSALLQQIYEEYNSVDKIQHEVERNNVKVIKYTMAVQDTSLLDVVLNQCTKANIVGKGTTRKTLKENLLGWLREGPGRRLLMLLDECDSILDKDYHNSFHDVWELRNIMQDSARSFKVVFTGLHSVQRFSQVPNNPLYHFGAPICIGPLSTDAAYGLMTRPMNLLGLEFETPQLVQMALNYCNYQPKLIQMFCSELVKGISNLSSREPVHVIDKSTMLKVYDSQDLKTRIRDCFTMTLELDMRYLVIGYVMALSQGEDISIRKLQSELRSYWPDAFTAGSGGDVNTLQTLLHEMEGLGLVISLGGSYRLRTPNITELLGGQENVLLQLEQFYDRPYQPEADPDELRMGDSGVLVASQYNVLADKSSRISWISGSKALGLAKIPDELKDIAQKSEEEGWGKMRYAALSGMTVMEAMKSLRSHYEKTSEGGLIVSISSEVFPYLLQFMHEAENWLGQLRTDRKYVKIVCLVEPDCLYGFIRQNACETLSSYQIPLVPWTENSVLHWCKDRNSRCTAKEIMDKTSGWPCLVPSALSHGQAEHLHAGDFIPDARELREIVISLRDLGEPCPEKEISAIIDVPEGLTELDFQRCLELLKSLHVLRESPDGLRLDPIAAAAVAEDAR